MASSDNGKQHITFHYQQEGTAKGFNGLLHGIIPTGIINGGLLTKVNNTQVTISPMNMIISDGSTINNTTVHVWTEEDATVNTSATLRYIVATFNWAELSNNYVTFEAVTYADLQQNRPNSIVIGECTYVGETMDDSFDYSLRTWSSIYYNNDFMYQSNYNKPVPSFYVTPLESTNELGFYVHKGDAIINGKQVKIETTQKIELQSTTENTDNYIYQSIQFGRTDIVVVKDDGNIKYIMGEDKNEDVHNPPQFPSNALVIAKIKFTSNVGTHISGKAIEYIYNNNYFNNCGTIGINAYNSNTIQLTREHTLFM